MYWSYVLAQFLCFAQRCAMLEPLKPNLQKIWWIVMTIEACLIVGINVSLLFVKHPYMVLDGELSICAFQPSELVKYAVLLEGVSSCVLWALGLRAVYRYVFSICSLSVIFYSFYLFFLGIHIYRSIYLSIHLSICLSIYIYLCN